LLLSNRWFSQYYAKWFKRKPNGLKTFINGLMPARPISAPLVFRIFPGFYG
jgi:hypothetical protein